MFEVIWSVLFKNLEFLVHTSLVVESFSFLAFNKLLYDCVSEILPYIKCFIYYLNNYDELPDKRMNYMLFDYKHFFTTVLPTVYIILIFWSY